MKFKYHRWFQALVVPLVALAFHIFFGYRVIGRENIPEGGCVVCPSKCFIYVFYFKYCHLSLPPNLIKIFQLLLKLSKKDCQNTIEDQIIKSCKEHRPDRT